MVDLLCLRRNRWGSALILCGLLVGGIFSATRMHGIDSKQVRADEPATPPKFDAKTRQAIDRGLQFIVSTIRRDGTVGTDLHQPPDLGCTAIVGLTLLAEGSTPRGGKYTRESTQVLYGVLDLITQRPLRTAGAAEVTLIQRKIGMNADLFFATLYLSEVYYEAPGAEREIRSALEKLIQHIGATQGKDGTWGNESWAPILGTVMGWECLRSASSAGFQIDASAKLVGDALLANLKKRSADEQNWMHEFYKDASSLRVLYSMNYRDEPVFKECVDRLLNRVKTDSRPFQLAGGEEYLSFFLVTECLLKEKRPDWAAWYPRVRDELMLTQNRDGSWTGHHCITNRTFCTSTALLTLLAPNMTLTMSEL
ncbi:hypothetical protein [Planctomicrobium sp. SH527]|uniref:hypothetical protein n=1 Tax=Planctomicrobium sp. SH527 TaxID=3448123 RepID=UPI003F5B4F02